MSSEYIVNYHSLSQGWGSHLSDQKNVQHFLIVCWILIAIVLGYMPFYDHGVFYPNGHANFDFILLLLLAIYAVGRSVFWLLLRIKGRNRSATSATSTVNVSEHTMNAMKAMNPSAFAALRWFTLYDVAFVLYTLLYVLAIREAASVSLAVGGAFDALAMILPYGLLRLYGFRAQGALLLLCSTALASILVNIVGMANGWHQLTYTDAIVKSPTIQVSSVFQYHNSYAAFASAMTVGLLVYAACAPNQRLLRSLFTGVAALNLCGLLLSGSRGALLFWFIVMILVTVGLRGAGQSDLLRSRFLLHFYAAAVGCAVGYVLIRTGIVHSAALEGWLGILLALLLPALLVFLAASAPIASLMKTFAMRQPRIGWQPAERRTFLHLLTVGGALAIIGILMKTHSFLAKLHTFHLHQMSVIQRFIFWWDGLRIVARHPLFGNGFGAWSAMFMRVETYSYYSTEVHSFLMDVLIDVGIVGLLALLLGLWPMVRAVVWPWHAIAALPFRTTEDTESALAEVPLLGLTGQELAAGLDDATHRIDSLSMKIHSQNSQTSTLELHSPMLPVYRAWCAASLMLFAHAIMDWDMAYLSLLLLFTLGLGAAIALRNLAVDANQRLGFSPVRTHNWTLQYWLRRITFVAASLATLTGLVYVYRDVEAQGLAQNVIMAPTPQAQMAMLQAAYRLTPYNPVYLAEQGMIYEHMPNPTYASHKANEVQALSLFEQGEPLDPFNPAYDLSAAALAADLGQYQIAANNAINAYENAPFFPKDVSMAINTLTLDAMHQATVHPHQAKRTFQRVQTLYQDYGKNLKVVKQLPSYLPPLGNYILDDSCYDALAIDALVLHQTQNLHPFLAIAMQSKNAQTVAVAELMQHIVEQQSPKQIAAFVNAHKDLGAYGLLLEGLQSSSLLSSHSPL